MTARRYAAGTKVPVDRTRAEIERLLMQHGATGFVYGSAPGQAMLVFEMNKRRLKFLIPMPDAKADQAEARRRYRALLLVLKAKLEAVASKIVTFDTEFLPFIVMAGAHTIGEQLTPNLANIIATGKLPPLLGSGTP